MALSKIEWTESTWNPVTGCTKISDGCLHCYAERMSKRLKAMGQYRYRNGFTVTTHSEALEIPFKWKKSRMIFVNSMSDLFHEEVPDDFIFSVFDVMNKNPRHVFQVLTKRAERLHDFSSRLSWSNNIWMGVSVENNEYTYRIDLLKMISARIKFISFEPLLKEIPNPDLSGIDWVIVGGESGPGARPMEKEWVNIIIRTCEKNSNSFFFKQWGGTNKKKTGRILDGKTWDDIPVVAGN